jgi:hypothetical protein
MVGGQLAKKSLSINPKFFFFYNSFINKSTGAKGITRIFDNLKTFRWFFRFQLGSLFKLYLLIFRKFRKAGSVFSWISSKRTTRFYNEGAYKSQCSSFKVFKFYLLNMPSPIDRFKVDASI